MRKKIDVIWYDTAIACLVTEAQNMTAFSGRISMGFYRSHNDQWLQYIRLTRGNDTGE
nr:hypothetical protein [uncultured Desulfobacter sp.]